MATFNALDYWIYGYGSLMWRPGFHFVEMAPAELRGWRRDMCIQSIHYRGTPELPGLVGGLTPGGSCKGRAFRVLQEDVDEVIAYLDERELITDVYLPEHHEIVLDHGRTVSARVYVADVGHEHFAGYCSLEEKITYLRQGLGTEGSSIDYLAKVVSALGELGIRDDGLSDLLKHAQAVSPT